MECRTADYGSLIQLEPTKDRNFKRLVDSIRSAFSNHNYERAREESKHLICLEIAARIFYLILLKEKFPNIKPRDYLVAKINGGQESILTIKDELRLEYENVDLVSIIESALDYLKNKLVGQKSLIFAIDEANVANKKLFYGDFRNSNGKPRGLLTPIVAILNLFNISIIVAGTSFPLNGTVRSKVVLVEKLLQNILLTSKQQKAKML
ncbi:hypothetical protein RhiirC2_307461 [Rhizophagus irregularis]|uniref:Uncharacterized protein n=1 Tax=Rhizophagus irregularis TaxID=588596 RepID=A0A2N1NJX3_9GLOM|nr:hypothetical protein RhiirC2_307461 [Rhizophagus irregularis]